MALSSLAGTAYPAAAWEEFLLPARVKNYRENLLDSLLSEGGYFWHMEEGGKVRFDRTGRIDWQRDCMLPAADEGLPEKERLLLEALARRGASFAQALSGVLPGESLYSVLLSLTEKGLVCADSFVPVRQWQDREKNEKAAARRRVGARVKALHAGRYDLVRPLRALTVQEQMDECFDRYLVLCRETAAAYGLSWQEALALLRVQEYTGQVRRGYFVRGLSGAQFVRSGDFGGVTAALSHPQQEWIWLNAADPMQPWGKLLPHEPGRAFANVPGTAVALRGGLPAALFERQGRTLRVFDMEGLEEALRLFVQDYKGKRIFAGKKRIVVKEYPAEAAACLVAAGFGREMQDYALYR